MIRILILIIIFWQSLADKITDFRDEMNRHVKDFADEILNRFQKFKDSKDYECPNKSYFQCEGTSPLKCYDNFETLEGCLGSGIVFAQKSVVSFNSSDRNKLSPEQKFEICSTSTLEPYFQQLNKKRRKQFGTAYIGTPTGIIRSHPSNVQLFTANFSCQDYDPRLRQWYTQASISGRKNIVLIIDLANTVSPQLETMKKVASNYIRSLKRNDFLSVIGLDSLQRVIVPFTKITEQQKSKIIVDNISTLNYSGLSNISQGFQKAFELLDEENNNGNLCCQHASRFHVVLNVINNQKTFEQESIQQIQQIIQQNSKTYKTQLFISQVTNNKTNKNTNKLACTNNGAYSILSQIASDETVQLHIQSINLFMARNQQFNTIWTQYYLDAFYEDLITSVVRPIYYFDDNKNGYFVGIAGIDVPASYISDNLKANSIQFSRQFLQDYQYKIQDIPCEDLQKVFKPPEIKESVLIDQPQNSISQKCCFTGGALAGIIVGSVLFLALIIGVLTYCFHDRLCPSPSPPSPPIWHPEPHKINQQQLDPRLQKQLQKLPPIIPIPSRQFDKDPPTSKGNPNHEPNTDRQLISQQQRRK